MAWKHYHYQGRKQRAPYKRCVFIYIENKRNYIILNSVKQRKIYTSTVFEKYGNEDYILSFLEKDIHIFTMEKKIVL